MNRASQDIYFMLFTGILVLGAMIAFIIHFVIRYRQKQRHYLMEKQKMLIDFENQMLLTQLEIKEQTFKVISQEIHDNIGQMLSLAKLNLAIAIEEGPNQQRIVESHQLLSQSIYDLRNLAHSLDTDYVARQGLNKCLSIELERISKTGLVETDILIEGNVFTLNKQKELVMFRIAQESFSNILRHACASQIRLSLHYDMPKLSMLIADNGIGMDSEKAYTGSGLSNMQSRAMLIGAAFNLQSTLNSGTTISISLPNGL